MDHSHQAWGDSLVCLMRTLCRWRDLSLDTIDYSHQAWDNLTPATITPNLPGFSPLCGLAANPMHPQAMSMAEGCNCESPHHCHVGLLLGNPNGRRQGQRWRDSQQQWESGAHAVQTTATEQAPICCRLGSKAWSLILFSFPKSCNPWSLWHLTSANPKTSEWQSP